MPLLQQRISNLLGGVSQRPLVEMFQNQLVSSDNWIARLTYGLVKRPPFTYVAKLTSTLTGVDSAFMFAINRSEDERYRVIVRDGTIAVLDAETGDAVTVEDRSAGSYLDAVSGKSYRAVTVGDETYIVNQGVTVAKDTDKSAAQVNEAMVTVEQADFSTTYTVDLNGIAVSITTADADTPASRKEITTERIAELLRTKLAFQGPSGFTYTPMGSTIHISSPSGFAIDVTDGLGDNGLFLVKGEVESIEDLNRTRAPHGTKVKVLGSRGTDSDDYWVEYDSSAADASEDSTWGIWKETVAPSTLLRMDADTMPHKLVYQSSKLGQELETKDTTKPPSAADAFGAESTGGWTEDSTGSSITEADGQTVTQPTTGFQRLIPGADGTARKATVRYHIDTSKVEPGQITIVTLSHDIDGGGEVTLAQDAHEWGISGTFIMDEVADFAAADKIRLILSNNQSDSPTIFNRPALSVNGSGHDPAPIAAAKPDGIDITITPGTYFEGLSVDVTIDGTDFSYDVQDGDGEDEIATGLAALINADATYTSSATDNVVGVTVTADSTDDVDFESADITFVDNTAILQLPEGLTLGITEDEFVGDELVNITDGSSGTITTNDTAGLFTVDAFTGGADNVVTAGDILVVEGTDSYFVFQQVDWESRRAGDTTTNPWPSFVRREINDVFFFRNRLGFLTGAHVVMSQSGKRTNFFRSTVIDILDGGRIDVESAHPEVSDFQHAVVWNRNLFLWSDSAQYELGGEPVLSPKTVRLDVLSRFSNSRKVPPLVLGRRILFAHQQQGHVRIYEWAPPTDAEPVFQAIDITKEVPTYMPGEVVQMAGDYGHGLMALICDGDQDAIYIYSYADNPDGSQAFGAWQRATLPTGATARQLVFVDGKLSVITSYTDGIFLDEGDYDQPAAGDDDTITFLDRQVTEDDGLIPNPGPIYNDANLAFDAESGNSDADDAQVTTWEDEGIDEYLTELSQVSSGTLNKEDQINGLPAIFFDGSDGGRLQSSTTAPAGYLQGEATFYAVFKLDEISPEQPLISYDGVINDSGSKPFVIWVDSSGRLAVVQGDGVFNTLAISTTTLVIDTWYAVAIRINADNSVDFYINDDAADTVSGSAPGATTRANNLLRVGGVRFGTLGALTEMFHGLIAEISYFDEAQSDSLVSEILTNMLQKYGLAAGVSWGLPYDDPEDEVEVVDPATGEAADEDTVDPVGGIPFTARGRLAPFYLRGDKGQPETGGRLQVRRMDVEYNRTQDLKVEVTPAGRSKYTHTIDEATLQQGERRVPIMARGEDTVIELVSDGTGDARVSSIDAEFFYHNRSRRT